MAVTFLGTKSVGAACIGVALAVPALAAALADLLSRLADLQGQVAANIALITSVPDPMAILAAIEGAVKGLVDNITGIVASIPGPLIEANATLGLDIAALLALKLQLETLIGTLTAAVSAGGVHAFKVDSTPAMVGTELAALVSGGIAGGLSNARIQGVLFVTESPATFSALSSVLLTG